MSPILIDVGDGTLIVPPPAAPPPAPAPAPPPAATPIAPAPAPAPVASPLPQPGHPLIDVGDGTLIVAPPVVTAPAPPPPPQPVAAPAPPAPSQPIPQPGHPLVDLGDVLGPSELIPAPPVVPGAGGGAGAGGDTGAPVGGTDDLDEIRRLLAGYSPDLTGLPELEFRDPFGLQLFGATDQPLKGGGALTAIAQASADYGVDTRAAVANAIHEGAGGGIGDGGTSYGPFQLHQGGALPSQFNGRGRSDPVVNAWAWSENGIRYAVRSMAAGSPSAKGLTGHAAVYAIVYGFERPADKAGAYKTRAAEYDKLVKLGSGWPGYAAPLLKGPIAGGGTDTTPITSTQAEGYKPAGAVAQWRELVDVFKLGVPKQHNRVQSLADSLVEVFR